MTDQCLTNLKKALEENKLQGIKGIGGKMLDTIGSYVTEHELRDYWLAPGLILSMAQLRSEKSIASLPIRRNYPRFVPPTIASSVRSEFCWPCPGR